MLIHLFFSFIVTGFNELYPLWASTSKQYNCLGFSAKDIGTSLILACIPLVFSLVIIIAKISQRFGIKKMYIGGLIFLTVTFAVFPSISYIQNQSVVWILLIVFILIIRIAFAGCFTSANVMITTAVGK